MELPAASISKLDRVSDVVACDAFCSADDGLYHAVLLQQDGTLLDLSYGSSGPRGSQVIGTVPGARDVTAFWSDVNDVRNVIVIGAGGDVWHFIQDGRHAWTRTLQRNVPGALRIAGYDDHHHGIVLAGDGEITDQPFHTVTHAVAASYRADVAAMSGPGAAAAEHVPSPAADEREDPIVVGRIASAVDIAALWADGQNRFVIVADATGAVIEIGYGRYQPASRRELARLPRLRCVNACYTDDPAEGRCVAALTDTGDLFVLRYATDTPHVGEPMVSLPASDVACYTTPEGEVRAVLVSGDQIVDVVLPREGS
jgi:hypothetical protein